MLSPDKRQQIEREAARETHRFHRDIQPTTFASVVDDIRHKVIEEGWFGKQVTGDISHARISDDITHDRSTEVSEHQALYGEPVAGWSMHDADASNEPLLDIHGNATGSLAPEHAKQNPPTEKKEPEVGL